MTVVWSPAAIRHLEAVHAYIARENPDAADRIGDLLLAAVEHLQVFPRIGRPGRAAGTREWIVPGTPYLFVYRLRPERLEIIALFHGRQRWPDDF